MTHREFNETGPDGRDEDKPVDRLSALEKERRGPFLAELLVGREEKAIFECNLMNYRPGVISFYMYEFSIFRMHQPIRLFMLINKSLFFYLFLCS